MAICYRTDLFKAAGLPIDREEVGKLWPTWDAFIEQGTKFAAADPKNKFVDSATNFFNVVLMPGGGAGTGYTYYDKSNKLVLDTNPDIKTAFDLTTKMISAKLSNNLQSFSNEWNAGFKNGTFATIACPAWMTGVIKGQAGDSGSRQVGRGQGARQRRQLGRLLPRRTEVQQAPARPRRTWPST